MAPRNWSNNSNTLLYKLHTERLYDQGGYAILCQDGRIQAGSGWHTMTWHPDISLLGSRSYTLPDAEFRFPQAEIWHHQICRARQSGTRVIVGCFNHYNRKLIPQAIKINDPDNHKRSYYQNGQWYREPGVRILPLKTLDYSVDIHHTEQWIVYHVIDWNFYEEFLDICKNNEFGR